MKSVTVLFSGGIDSTACLQFYLSKHFSVQALFVDYGQIAMKCELKSAKQISLHYDIPLKIITCQNVRQKGSGVIHGRNAFLLFIALMELNHSKGLLGLGIHSRTNYSDCSKNFLIKSQELFDIYTDGQVKISAPFLSWAKSDIWNYCLKEHVPINLTYSCEVGNPQPCGACLSCLDLEALRALPELTA